MRRPKKRTRTGPSSDAIGGGNDWTVVKRSIGYRKKPTVARLAKMVNAGMNKQIWRWQNITNFDTNVGGITIANYQFTNGIVESPVHVYDITSFNNVSNFSPSVKLGWASTAGTADVVRAQLPCQNADGTIDTSGVWKAENLGGLATSASGFTNARTMRHDWTDIRLNFYGPRKRTTRYDVMFVRVRNEFANPLNAGINNAALKELLMYLERPCIFSNLNTHQPGNISKMMKVVKRYSYWVSAGQTTDVDTTIGKIKEARIFMRHDRNYNLDWRHESGGYLYPHEQADGADYVNDVTHHNHPWHGSRVFMIIRAFAPERRSGLTYSPYPTADANVDPTYDILIRNCVSVPQ